MKNNIFLFFIAIFCFEVMAAPSPQPIIKYGGSCPTGYVTSGGSYCSPTRNARFAIIKVGNGCPSGYISSGGGYCLSVSENTKTAIYKEGSSCPNGFTSNGGGYCLSVK